MAQSMAQETIRGEKERAMSQYDDSTPTKWQKRLLPLMKGMIIGLTIFFFLASFGQLIYLHLNIEKVPHQDIGQSLSLLSDNSELTFQEKIEASRLKAITMLEANAL
ncbi:MAG: hypothetical protein GWN00_05655, partial [Aliifodinibius sp.]|nr:hypothetical protein [Fodinibius sp.]NIV10694.1 hypothetical protein [Fodinibius sp.]NIY24309.1 hypothetical protein [Fodinibius sp.]